jgi:hypothetical protein
MSEQVEDFAGLPNAITYSAAGAKVTLENLVLVASLRYWLQQTKLSYANRNWDVR